MRHKNLFIPVVALIVLANISFSAIQDNNSGNFTLKSLLSIKSAEAEHTATYTCYDESYNTTKVGLYNYQKRVCHAPNCGKNYIRWKPNWTTGTCTLTYN